MKAVMLDGGTLGVDESQWSALGAMCELTFYNKTVSTEVVERAKEADAVFTNKVVLDRETLKQLPALKYIGVLATGVDIIDLDYAKEKGIVVSNVPAYSTQSVAQHVFALLLSLSNQVNQHDASIKKGDWVNSEHFSYWLNDITELAGKTLGLVGFGHIAQAVMRIGLALGMRLIAYTPRAKTHPEVEFVSLESLFKESDVLSLHCPLTQETADLINASRLQLMKKTAILINTGRGGLIDEMALAQALKQNDIQAACLDVLKKEPPGQDNPLIDLNNCILTPHVAWASKEARMRLMDKVMDNFSDFIKSDSTNVVTV